MKVHVLFSDHITAVCVCVFLYKHICVCMYLYFTKPLLCFQCKNMVDNYLTEIVQMMEKEIDPQMICSLLGLCKGLKDTVQHHQVNSLHRVPLIKVCCYYSL